MEISQLIDIGLTKNQAIVYLELIKNPGQNPGKLAKHLALDRSFVYGIINNLMEKGLVTSVIKENKQLFYSSDPENLLKELDEKRNKTIEIVKRIKEIKPKSKKDLSVRSYEGIAGLKAYVREFLQSDDFLTFGGGGSMNFFKSLEYDYPHYLKDLKKRKLKGKLITSRKNKEILKELYSPNIDIKCLENLNKTTEITVLDGKVGFYTNIEKPRVIIIEDENIAETLKVYFNQIWKQAKK